MKRRTTGGALRPGLFAPTLLLLSCLVGGVGAAWAQAPSSAGKKAPATPEAPDAGEMLYQVLLGELLVRSGDPGAGYSYILDAARKTSDARLFQRSVDIALRSGSGDGALSATRAWSQALPQDRKANLQQLQILLAINRMPETLEPLQRELQLAPDVEKSSVMAAIPRLYARATDKRGSADLVAQVLQPYTQQKPLAGAAWATIGRMRLAAEDVDATFQAAQQGLRADADCIPCGLLGVELLNRQYPGAEALVLQVLPRTDDPDLNLAYVRFLVEQKRYAEAQRQLERMTQRTPESLEPWLILGSLHFEFNRPAEAEKALSQYVTLALKQTNPSPAVARGLTQAQTRRAELLAKQGKLDEARVLLGRLPPGNRTEQRARLLAEIQLLRDHKQWQVAYDLLAQIDNKDNDLRYEQAMLAERLKRYDEMEALLREILRDDPSYHHAYNALGFSFAERNIRLSEARQLITKAVELAPDDPFIQDSLGWVEFRLGNLGEALNLLQKAFAARPDPEIAAHLGEVLWQLKRAEEARQIWRQGLQLGPDHDTLRDTIRRLSPGL